MLKVFLVEDEYVVREGIKKNIQWAEHGYEFCGDASDGELAFPMIQKLKPDIVITDIRMPFMDGLALSRLVKKELPDTQILILTGFEEFAYAKEALRIGVAEYLTKPISGDELLKNLDAVADKIYEKRREQQSFSREMEESLKQEKQELFRCLVEGTKNTEELLEKAEQMKITVSALWYNIVLFKLQTVEDSYEEYLEGQMELEEKLSELESEMGLLLFDRGLEGKAYIFMADTSEELVDQQEAFVSRTEEILKQYPNIGYFGGIGIPVSRLRELSVSFEKASHAFAHRYLMKENAFVDCAKLERGAYIVEEDFLISSVNPKQMDRSRILDFLKLGNKEDISYFLDEFFAVLGNGALHSTLFRQYMVMDIYFTVAEFVESLSLDKSEIPTPDLNLNVYFHKEGVMEYATQILEKAITLRELNVQGRYNDVVNIVTKYIEEHYSEEDISLNILAAQVNFSPNHLSLIFSQQTGQTLIKYLTDYRMSKARELLRCTGKRSSEIGAEVGYKDPHYFSYLFKKLHGVTPTEYRGKKQKSDKEEV